MVDTGNPLFVVDTNDPDQIRKDVHAFFSAWCPGSDDDDAETIKSDFDSQKIDLWWLGARASGLVQVYDLVAPLDPDGRAAQYLERVRRIAGALLDNRDDHGSPQHVDPFRERVMAHGVWSRQTATGNGTPIPSPRASVFTRWPPSRDAWPTIRCGTPPTGAMRSASLRR